MNCFDRQTYDVISEKYIILELVDNYKKKYVFEISFIGILHLSNIMIEIIEYFYFIFYFLHMKVFSTANSR